MKDLQKLIEETARANMERLDQWVMGILASYLKPKELKIIAGHRKKGNAKLSLKLLKKKRIYLENIHDQGTGFKFFMIRKGQQTVGFKQF